MQFQPLSIPDLILITPKVFEDDRGFFMEAYNKQLFKDNGIDVDFVQDNYSRSSKDVLRGLHFQKGKFAQDKLVRVVKGKVLDVAVDLRKGSKTFGKYEIVELSEENKKVFFVPKGFAHGFLVISDTVDFEYKVSGFYNKESDCGLLWNDSEVEINWEIENPILSEKDKIQPTLQQLIERGDIF